MRWFLDTVRGQIIAIVIGTTLLTVAIISILLAFARPEMPPRPHGPWSDLLQIKAIVEAIQAASPQDRQRIAQAVSSDELRVQEGPSPACATPMTDPITQGLQMTLVNLLGSRVDTISVRQCAEEPGKRSFLVDCLPILPSLISCDRKYLQSARYRLRPDSCRTELRSAPAAGVLDYAGGG